MSKGSQFVCQQCGYSQVGWAGKCPECGSWNSLVETVVHRAKSIEHREKTKKSELISLSSISSKSILRISTKIGELDRVLGGGLVLGQVVLIAGEPGIGKSTLLLQLSERLGNILYVSGEESASQIAIRAQRLGIRSKTIKLLEETDIDSVIETIQSSASHIPYLTSLIIDSIQTMATNDLTGMAGSVGQVRECAYRLVRLAKSLNIPVFLVGHVTKEGTVAGPSVLMHIVDTVLWFEGEKNLSLRLLRAVKNRFGPTDEVGVFSMEDEGLVSVTNPEGAFLIKDKQGLPLRGKKEVPGSVVTSILQGTRPILVEIQSLVVPTKLAYPKRIAQGIPSPRFEILLATLIRRCGLPFYENDCFLNVSGGISINKDPSADLAICLSLASAFFDRPLPKGAIAIGEVSLLGDIREVIAQERRVKEVKRLGFNVTITNRQVKSLQEAIRRYLR